MQVYSKEHNTHNVCKNEDNYKDLKNTFGKKIKTLRNEKGMTQEELANILDTTRNHIGNLETGRSGFSAKFLYDASLFFNCTTDYLLGLSHTKENQIQTVDDVYDFIDSYESNLNNDNQEFKENYKQILKKSIQLIFESNTLDLKG